MSLFDKLAAEESSFFTSQFLSPVLKGNSIRVRIAGVIVNLKVTRPKDFNGWGIFSALTYKTCRFVREPNMVEKGNYLKLFPVLRLILCRNEDNMWMGIPSHQSDTRFKIVGMVPVQLVSEVQLFDTIYARFDGINCWFEQIDPKHSLKAANYLRESLVHFLEPEKLSLTGLTLEEKDAYLIALGRALETSIEAKRNREEERIKSALHRAGARYQSYIDRGDTYTIEYAVNGHMHRSVVKKNDLSVEVAGICLSGGDRVFDLQSLVGVIREGENRGRIVRVAIDNGSYQHYPGEDLYRDDDYD